MWVKIIYITSADFVDTDVIPLARRFTPAHHGRRKMVL